MARKTSNYDYDDYDDDYYDDYDDYDDGNNYSKPVQVAKPKVQTKAKTSAAAPTNKKPTPAGAKTKKTGSAPTNGSVTGAGGASKAAAKAPPPSVFSVDHFEPPMELSKLTVSSSGSGISVGKTNASTPRTGVVAGTEASASSNLLPSDDEDEAAAALAGHDVLTSSAADGLTVIIVGHVDAGKSTLIGQLLVKLGYVSQQVLRRYTKEAAATGKASFQFAWVMDENSTEREHGVTVDIAEKLVVTPGTGRELRLLDAPGHRDYVPRLLAGLPLADAALLVIPASVGEYEASMGPNAQTREHATLLKASGVGHVVIVVNKMDSTAPAFSSERFATIVADLGRYLLEELHFTHDQLHFVPVSAFAGENLCALSQNCPMASWWKPGSNYSGLTLVQTLEGLVAPHFAGYYESMRALVASPPANLPTHGSSGAGSGSVEVYLRICRGRLRVGSSVGIASSARAVNGGVVRCVVKKIVCLKQDSGRGGGGGSKIDCNIVYAGQFALAYLQATGLSAAAGSDSGSSLSKGAAQDLLVQAGGAVGTVIMKGPGLEGCRPHMHFRCMVRTLPQLASPIIPGSSFAFHTHGCTRDISCVVRRLCAIVTPGAATSDSQQGGIKCVPAGQLAVVELVTSDPMVLEPISGPQYYHGNSRFVLRHKGQTVATGVCERHLE